MLSGSTDGASDAIAFLHCDRKMPVMEPAHRDHVVALASEAGISVDLFNGWDGHELALYPNAGGLSASVEVAQQTARENARRGEWVVDLGNRAFAISSTQGTAFRAKLDEDHIVYETGPQTLPYLKRTRWAVKEHRTLIDELAKR